MLLSGANRSLGTERVLRLQAGACAVEIVSDTHRLETRFGPRFDGTAFVSSVSTAAHSYLAAEGLADEFGLEGMGVLGYREAPLNGEFIKIGVGVLVRDTTEKYRFQHAYPVARRFPVTVEATDETVRVIQLSERVDGYQYRYEKTYRTVGNGVLAIDYVLANLGLKEFPFDHYNHNFFAFDGEGGSDSYAVTAAFPWPQPPAGAWHLDAQRRLCLSSEKIEPKGVYWGTPLEIGADLHQVTLRHRSGEAVIISGNTPSVRFAIWADRTAICPELFIRHQLAPGASCRWTRTYRFGSAVAITVNTPRA
jgi:hypothetical protein